MGTAASSEYHAAFHKFSLPEQMINSKLFKKDLLSVAHHTVYFKLSLTLKIMCPGWEGKSRRTYEEEWGMNMIQVHCMIIKFLKS